jgi:hypothetical protein
MATELYSRGDVARIHLAYQGIFPVVSPALADFWGYSRERPWSWVTSDFRNTIYEQYAQMHAAARRIDAASFPDLDAKGAALRAAAREAGVGYSLGINPWTDNLLLETYRDNADCLTVILAHDWYPIATTDKQGRWRESDAPLRADDNLHRTHKYHAAAPEAVLERRTVGLYLNLYPDYRPPGWAKTGEVGQFGYSYGQCLAGLDELVASLHPRFTKVSLISWGVPVWAQLSRRTAAPRGMKLTRYTRDFSGHPVTVELGGRLLPYLPLIHPCMGTNFGQPQHYRHLAHGFQALGLGLAGSSASRSTCVASARAVLATE